MFRLAPLYHSHLHFLRENLILYLLSFLKYLTLKLDPTLSNNVNLLFQFLNIILSFLINLRWVWPIDL